MGWKLLDPGLGAEEALEDINRRGHLVVRELRGRQKRKLKIGELRFDLHPIPHIAYRALTTLHERLEAAELDMDERKKWGFEDLFQRAKAAEARVQELEGALRDALLATASAYEYGCEWPIGIDTDAQEQRGMDRDTFIRNMEFATEQICAVLAATDTKGTLE